MALLRRHAALSELSLRPFRSVGCSGTRAHGHVWAHELSRYHAPRSWPRPGPKPRVFKSFQAAVAEAAVSRLYGGIHYSFDNNDGLKSGECIGQTILERVNSEIERICVIASSGRWCKGVRAKREQWEKEWQEKERRRLEKQERRRKEEKSKS